ncbi:alpha/beta fold hydrolase [Sphingopyxis sp. MWB1]|uniref:alpha/beta fold hydrolase n=1 Tax=Sphingopyxis sp. MWB1 TaxID=1537715 RepID=UPI00051A0F66|nr:alpha/beta hydrolase [Sphingopyxis sp. MWB1]
MTRLPGHPQISMEQARGFRLRVARWRIGAGAVPLLFLNGIGADIAAAAPLLSRIQGREVWTLDMPGVGGSPDSFFPYALSSMAGAVIDIADRLGHRFFDVAGFSWGGALAQQIGANHPARIRRLALLATTGSIEAPGLGWSVWNDSDMLASGLRLPTATPLGIAYQALAMAGWNGTATLPAPRERPVLILTGARDGIVPASHGARLAALIEGAELEEMPGSHLFPFTHASRVAARLTDFLDQPANTPAKGAPVAAY